jgi:hypothetical protein
MAVDSAIGLTRCARARTRARERLRRLLVYRSGSSLLRNPSRSDSEACVLSAEFAVFITVIIQYHTKPRFTLCK